MSGSTITRKRKNCAGNEYTIDDLYIQDSLVLGPHCSFTFPNTTLFLAADGSAALPSYSFASDATTGIYKASAGTLAISTAGVQRWSINSTSTNIAQSIRGANGNAASPMYTFTSDTNTGMYRSSADTISFSCGGTSSLDVSNTSINTNEPVLLSAGTAAAPCLSFQGDTNTGFYRIAADDIGFAVAGTKQLEITTAATSIFNQTTAASGTVSAPAYTFQGDATTGLYRIGAGDVAFSISGTKVWELTSSNLSVSVPLNKTTTLTAPGTKAANTGTFYSNPTTANFSLNPGDYVYFNVFEAPAITGTGTGYQATTVYIKGPPAITGGGSFANGNVALEVDGATYIQGSLQMIGTNQLFINNATTDASAYNNAPNLFSGGVGIAKKLIVNSTISNGNGLVTGMHFLTTKYLFLNNATFNNGSFTAWGNGTPAIPTTATAVLISIYGVLGSGNYILGNDFTTGIDTTNLYNNVTIGQVEGSANVIMATAIIPLDNAGKFTLRVSGAATLTNGYASVTAYFG